MNCINCGELLPEGKLFCPKCGFYNEVSIKENQSIKSENFIFEKFISILSLKDLNIVLLFSIPFFILSILELYRLLTTILTINQIIYEQNYWKSIRADYTIHWIIVKESIIYLLAFLSLIVSIKR